MTLDEFYLILSTTKDNYDWYLFGYDNRITSTLVNKEPTGAETRTSLCPITGVCFNLTKDIFHRADWPQAAEKINLPFEIARKVVICADNTFNRTEMSEVIKELPLDELKEIRSKLIDAAGIKFGLMEIYE